MRGRKKNGVEEEVTEGPRKIMTRVKRKRRKDLGRGRREERDLFHTRGRDGNTKKEEETKNEAGGKNTHTEWKGKCLMKMLKTRFPSETFTPPVSFQNLPSGRNSTETGSSWNPHKPSVILGLIGALTDPNP